MVASGRRYGLYKLVEEFLYDLFIGVNHLTKIIIFFV
jgi:hypothetical protein